MKCNGWKVLYMLWHTFGFVCGGFAFTIGYYPIEVGAFISLGFLLYAVTIDKLHDKCEEAICEA